MRIDLADCLERSIGFQTQSEYWIGFILNVWECNRLMEFNPAQVSGIEFVPGPGHL